MRRIVFIALLAGFSPVLYAQGPMATAAPAVITAAAQQPNGEPVALPLKPDSVRFGVIGDSGTGSSAQYDMGQEMQKIHQTMDFNFVIMLGDNLYGGHSPDDYVKKFEKPYKPLLDEGVNFYASLGNHDNTNEISYAPFNMDGQRYYTFTKGNAQFFVLDSNYMSPQQLEWLTGELQKSTADWKIAYFHHPLYSSGKRHGSDTDLRAVLEPVFRKYGVNVVLSGHDHVYERVTPQDGIEYFVLGSSGQLRSGGLERDSDEAAGFDRDRCFMVVEITGNDFYFQTVSRTGQIVDSGELKRQTFTASAGAKAPEKPSAGNPQ